jgi:hypothetical protein
VGFATDSLRDRAQKPARRTLERMWTMTTQRETTRSHDWTYERPVGVGLGVVTAAWIVTLTFLILMLFA